MQMLPRRNTDAAIPLFCPTNGRSPPNRDQRSGRVILLNDATQISLFTMLNVYLWLNDYAVFCSTKVSFRRMSPEMATLANHVGKTRHVCPSTSKHILYNRRNQSFVG